VSDFSDETARILRAAGWKLGRNVDTTSWRLQLEESGWFRMHQAASDFLSEFGGLASELEGPGVSCAREPFEFDPTLAIGEDDRFRELGKFVGGRLFPVGELGHGRFFLAIDEGGVIYVLAETIARLGRAPEAIERLVQGVAADPPLGAWE
jgi:hypothetical protein